MIQGISRLLVLGALILLPLTSGAVMEPEVGISGKVARFNSQYVVIKQKEGKEVFLAREWVKGKNLREGEEISVKVDIREAVAFNRNMSKQFGKKSK